jgi:hypothetical protein
VELKVEGKGAGHRAPGHVGPVARLDVGVEVEADWAEVATRLAQVALAEARAVAGVGQQQLVEMRQVLHLTALGHHHLGAQWVWVCGWLRRPGKLSCLSYFDNVRGMQLAGSACVAGCILWI